MKRFLFALAVALAGSAPALAGVVNGGFELGTPNDGATTHWTRLAPGDPAMSGWTVVSGNVDWLSSQALRPCEGSRSLDLNGNTNGAVNQTVATTPGKAYRVTFCLASNPNGLPDVKTLDVGATGKPAIAYSFDRTGHTLDNPGWIRKNYWFVASEESTTITFASTTTLPAGATGPNAFGPLIDDVAIGEYALAVPIVADQWWNHTESGWGAAVLQQGRTIFICFFVYGADGKPTWFVAVATLQAGTDGHEVFAGDVYATTGPWYGAPFDSVPVVERLAGTFKLDVTGTGSAVLDYVIDGVPVHKQVTRQFLAFEDLSGDYYGVVAWHQSGCADTEFNGDYVAAGPVEVVHDVAGNHAVITLHAEDATLNGVPLDLPPGVTITLDGAYTQTGHLGRVYGTSTTVVPGEPPDAGTFDLHQIERSVSGIVSRYQQVDNAGGCRAGGRFAAARR